MQLNDEQRNKIFADTRFQDIGNLPSNFYPYSFKNLMIRPLTVGELRLISKAATLDDQEHMLRAVDLCISEPAKELSIGDYFYVLAWLRLHSTPKAPPILNWTCNASLYRSKDTGKLLLSTDPVPEDLSKYEIVTCGCENSEPIHISKLDIIQIKETENFILPEGFDFPRAGIIQELKNLSNDPELVFLLNSAQWVAGASLKEKLEILMNQSDLDMFDKATALGEILQHGVRETTTLHCSQCRTAYDYELKLEPHNFFQ